MRDQFKDGFIDIEKALMFWVHRVQHASRGAMYREFRGAGIELTPEQWMVLVRLWEKDGRTQTELGQVLSQDRPTTSRILAGMEARDLLARRADPDSARVWRVYLTAQGKALRKKLVPVAQALVTRMQAGIPERDLLTTRATLERLWANMLH